MDMGKHDAREEPPTYADLELASTSRLEIQNEARAPVSSETEKAKIKIWKIAVIIFLILDFIAIIYVGTQIAKSDQIFAGRCTGLKESGRVSELGKAWMVYSLVTLMLLWCNVASIPMGGSAFAVMFVLDFIYLLFVFPNVSIGIDTFVAFNGQCFSKDRVFAFWMILGLFPYIVPMCVIAALIVIGIVYLLGLLFSSLNPFN